MEGGKKTFQFLIQFLYFLDGGFLNKGFDAVIDRLKKFSEVKGLHQEIGHAQLTGPAAAFR